MTNAGKTVRVAAIQLESMHGQVKLNQDRAMDMMEKAAARGAELIVLPELFVTGYIPNFSIWEYHREASSLDWIRDTARRLKLFIGMGLLEYLEGHFRNTFVLVSPEGEIEGRSVKENAESYIFQRGQGVHVIESRLGRIGVGICADNHLTRIVKIFRESGIHILLMPHAWPSPVQAKGLVSEKDRERTGEEVRGYPVKLARILGVPTVFVNQRGSMAPMAGILGKLMNPEVFRLQGHSKIVDFDGTVKAELGDEEGMALGEVTLTAAKPDGEIPDYRGWVHPGSRIIRNVLMPLEIFLGSLVYRWKLKKHRS